MLYPIYNSIKTALLAVDGVKVVQWFNAQYESTIVAEPALFIEFPNPIDPQQLSSSLQQAPLRVRVHVVSKAMASIDGSVADDSILKNEAIATAVKGCLKGLQIGELTPMRFVSWQHWHRWQGWMVTFVEFEAKMKM